MLRRDVFQGIFYICACMMCACVALLNASEDSVDAVMEGYESPQKLLQTSSLQMQILKQNLAHKKMQVTQTRESQRLTLEI